MSASSLEGNDHVAGRCHKRARFSTERARWLPGRGHVDSVRGDWLVARDHVHALFEHDVGTAVTLFARLEPDQNVALESVFVGGNQVSSSYADCHVQIVSAGVHVAVSRGVFESGVFLHGQGIHVGTQQNRWARLSAFDVQNDARNVVAQVNFP